ncbi:uncharacterized protein BDZ83DRAFT_3355 [Colletotrichum acutatum]|uniref:Uncharacterized protein n=1 Tax=Glomerella acutata TaxID=27357 RepID=A0AAD8XQZ6_GLOAC|nr:uncharacterized protein BDZ83DRAFT_3355 [Colletotrichum acutatum]KAK1731757.1 hypothetical protein BDZ83DRAFT_3355 [Colletotrichum acutatum]
MGRTTSKSPLCQYAAWLGHLYHIFTWSTVVCLVKKAQALHGAGGHEPGRYLWYYLLVPILGTWTSSKCLRPLRHSFLSRPASASNVAATGYQAWIRICLDVYLAMLAFLCISYLTFTIRNSPCGFHA